VDYKARINDAISGRIIQPDTLVPEPGSSQGYNRYTYVNNNPVGYTDSSGHWVETALDVAFITFDIYDIATNGLTWMSGLSLAADVACAILPIATGGGLAVRSAFKAGEAIDKVSDAARLIDKADEALDIVNHADDIVDTVSQVEKLSDAKEAVGGVYQLVNIETGDIMRTGRTGNLEQRMAQHQRNPLFKDFGFEPVWRTDDYATQRGLEQMLYTKAKAPYDKIKPISPNNVNIEEYMRAGKNFAPDFMDHP